MPDDASDAVSKDDANHLISLAEAAELTDLSHRHIRLLVRQRKIWGTKIGRNWVTTETAVREYLEIERKTGP